MIILWIMAATFAITLCVWAAALFLLLQGDKLSRVTMFLVSLSAGTLMGGAFLHLLPEASENLDSESLFVVALMSFVVFFLVEKILHWRHCHKDDCEVHTFGHMNLLGDSIHNFIDGLVIAGIFMADVKLGLVASFAVALHEIPQEIGDFGVLLHAGFTRAKALLLNYIVATTVLLGGITGYFVSFYSNNIIKYLLPFAAGGFIYIASSDLIPELRKEKNLKKSVGMFAVFLFGIFIMYAVKFIGE